MGGYPVNVMIDTGAAMCVTYKSIIKKAGIEYLLDKKSQIKILGAHGIKPSIGKIWLADLELDISNGAEQYVSIPINIDVNDDEEIIREKNKMNQELKNKLDEIIATKEIVMNQNLGKNILNNLLDIGLFIPYIYNLPRKS